VLTISEAREWFQEFHLDKTVKSLKKNGFDVLNFSSPEEAKSEILKMIPEDALVGVGGSVTIREMGLLEALKDRGYRIANHWEARAQNASTEEMMKIRRQHLNSDVFLTSTNSITETGELINIDGTGQRVAAMIFGPKKVIVIAGINKIAGSLEEGLSRARDVASPMNAKRLNLKTPCIISGVCEDCNSPERICNITTIIQRRPHNTDMTIVLIRKKLGY
jgi:L-lactate utilization protein LutB